LNIRELVFALEGIEDQEKDVKIWNPKLDCPTDDIYFDVGPDYILISNVPNERLFGGKHG